MRVGIVAGVLVLGVFVIVSGAQALELDLKVTPENFSLGDKISFSGHAGDALAPGHSARLSFFGVDEFFSTDLNLSSSGEFYYAYHGTAIDPASEWIVTLKAFDDQNAFFSKSISLVPQSAIRNSAFGIEWIEPVNRVFKRGEETPLVFLVKDVQGKPVENATLRVQAPDNSLVLLQPGTDGSYVGKIRLGMQTPLKEQVFRLEAEKIVDRESLHAVKDFVVRVEPGEIRIQVIEPDFVGFLAGQKMDFLIRAEYATGQSIAHATSEVILPQERVALIEDEPGLFSGYYWLPLDQQKGQLSLLFQVSDKLGNKSQLGKNIEILPGIDWLSTIAFHPSFSIAALLIGLALLTALFLIGRQIRQENKKKRRQFQLKKQKEELEKSFYVKKEISEEEFQKKSIELEEKLKKII